MCNEALIGKIVISKAGRDMGNPYIVVGCVNERTLKLADGRYKTVEMPKVKKLKHVALTNLVDKNLKSDILSSNKDLNIKIKRFLKQKGIIKEV